MFLQVSYISLRKCLYLFFMFFALFFWVLNECFFFLNDQSLQMARTEAIPSSLIISAVAFPTLLPPTTPGTRDTAEGVSTSVLSFVGSSTLFPKCLQALHFPPSFWGYYQKAPFSVMHSPDTPPKTAVLTLTPLTRPVFLTLSLPLESTGTVLHACFDFLVSY